MPNLHIRPEDLEDAAARLQAILVIEPAYARWIVAAQQVSLPRFMNPA